MVEKLLGVEISYHFQDAQGQKGFYSVFLDTTATTATPFASAFVPILYGVTDCTIIKYHINTRYRRAVRGTPSESAQNSRAGVLLFGCADDTRASMVIPSVREDVLTSTGDMAGILLDTTNSDVQALITQSLAGACSPEGALITEYRTGYLQWRKFTEV